MTMSLPVLSNLRRSFQGSGTGVPPARIAQPKHGRDARATMDGFGPGGTARGLPKVFRAGVTLQFPPPRVSEGWHYFDLLPWANDEVCAFGPDRIVQ